VVAMSRAYHHNRKNNKYIDHTRDVPPAVGLLGLRPDHASKQELLSLYGLMNDEVTRKGWFVKKCYSIPDRVGVLDVWDDYLHVTVAKGISMTKLKQIQHKLANAPPLQLRFSTTLIPGAGQKGRTLWRIESVDAQAAVATINKFFSDLSIQNEGDQKPFVVRMDEPKPHMTIRKYAGNERIPHFKGEICLTFTNAVLARPATMHEPMWTQDFGVSVKVPIVGASIVQDIGESNDKTQKTVCESSKSENIIVFIDDFKRLDLS